MPGLVAGHPRLLPNEKVVDRWGKSGDDERTIE
jgi:hypothetical protein